MSECVGNVFIENGNIRERADFDPYKVFEDEVVYEVIRIRAGIPVFLADHFERLENSASLKGNELLAGFDELREQILKLIDMCGIKEGNIKVSFKYSPSYKGYLVYFIKAQYPGPEMYRNGVKGILYYAERRNPLAKVFNHKLRSSIYASLIQAGAYEALLVNRKGCITEGSRSNAFFIREGRIITAPDNCVLGGITRKKILDICERENFSLEYRCLHVGELNTVHSAFMTGTSPSMLPFREIEQYRFSVENDMLNHIRERYMQMVDEYMKKFAKESK
ncbi:MAG: aminotransferase class IV [Bacteroidales bacterium]|nr:aminotransferase class IV [Bacteroidales bacterium]